MDDFFNSLNFKKILIKSSVGLFLLLTIIFSPLLTRQSHLFAFHHSFYSKLSIHELNGELQAGSAQVDDTPPVGYSHYRDVSTRIHDPLYTKAVAWREEAQRVALVSCDLLWIEKNLSSKVRLSVSKKINIPYSNVMIAGNHSRTRPSNHLNIDETITSRLAPGGGELMVDAAI